MRTVSQELKGSQLYALPAPHRVGAFCLKRDVLGKLCQDTDSVCCLLAPILVLTASLCPPQSLGGHVHSAAFALQMMKQWPRR